jgi:hypothetical protein
VELALNSLPVRHLCFLNRSSGLNLQYCQCCWVLTWPQESLTDPHEPHLEWNQRAIAAAAAVAGSNAALDFAAAVTVSREENAVAVADIAAHVVVEVVARTVTVTVTVAVAGTFASVAAAAVAAFEFAAVGNFEACACVRAVGTAAVMMVHTAEELAAAVPVGENLGPPAVAAVVEAVLLKYFDFQD